jgi:hypothetical protein
MSKIIERSGDALIRRWRDGVHNGDLAVYAHDDGGVTLQLIWNAGGEERLSYIREEWDAIVAFVSEAREAHG